MKDLGEFFAFVADVMNVKPQELSLETRYGEFPAWDSVMHLKLVMALEEEFDTEIPIEKIPDIKTLQDLYEYTHK